MTDADLSLLRDVADALAVIKWHAHVRNCPDCPSLIDDLLRRLDVPPA